MVLVVEKVEWAGRKFMAQLPDNISDYGQSSPDNFESSQVLMDLLRGQAQPEQPAPQVSTPQVSDPADTIREMLRQKAGQSPNDILLEKLHMSKGEKEKRSKWGNAGQVGLNLLQALTTGRNFRNEANKDYELQTQRMGQANETVRAADLAKKADEDRQLRELLGQKTAEVNAAKNETAKYKIDTEATTAAAKTKVLSDKNAIADSWNKARTGTAQEKQAAINKFNEYKMAHPDERPESFIADAIIAKSPTGQLNIGEYQAALNDFYKSQSLRQGPIVKTSEVPVYNSEGQQTGAQIIPTMINRQTGAQIQGGQGAAQGSPGAIGSPVGVSTPGSSINFGPQGNGQIMVPKGIQKELEPIKTAKAGADMAAQNLLQDLSSGKLSDYTGWLQGSRPMSWLREQGYAGDTSTGEALEKFLGPTNVIQHIRSLSPRLNQREIDDFSKAIGTTGQKGEILTKRAMIYAMSLDYRLQDKMNNIPLVPNGRGGMEKITNFPEYTEALRDSITKAVDAAKTGKGGAVKVPTIAEVLDDTRARLIKKQGGKVDEIREKLKGLISPPENPTNRRAKYENQ